MGFSSLTDHTWEISRVWQSFSPSDNGSQIWVCLREAPRELLENAECWAWAFAFLEGSRWCWSCWSWDHVWEPLPRKGNGATVMCKILALNFLRFHLTHKLDSYTITSGCNLKDTKAVSAQLFLPSSINTFLLCLTFMTHQLWKHTNSQSKALDCDKKKKRDHNIKCNKFFFRHIGLLRSTECCPGPRSWLGIGQSHSLHVTSYK